MCPADVRAARRATSISLKTMAASAEDTVGGVRPHLASPRRSARVKAKEATSMHVPLEARAVYLASPAENCAGVFRLVRARSNSRLHA